MVNTLSTALVEWKQLYKDHKETGQAYDQAYALARLTAADNGVTPNDRKYHADLDPRVKEARAAADLAEVAFKYADKRLSGVRDAISAWQSVGTFIRQAYSNAGRGEF